MGIFFASIVPSADKTTSEAEILDTDVFFDTDGKAVERTNGFTMSDEMVVQLLGTLK